MRAPWGMRGYTLIELLAVLTLFAIGASALAPTASRLADLAAVSAAREELVAILAEARVVAMMAGESTVIVVARPPSVRIESRGASIRSLGLGGGRPISLDLGRGRDSVSMTFNGLGLGRFANQTIEFGRGGASAFVVISSYGRVRRR